MLISKLSADQGYQQGRCFLAAESFMMVGSVVSRKFKLPVMGLPPTERGFYRVHIGMMGVTAYPLTETSLDRATTDLELVRG